MLRMNTDVSDMKSPYVLKLQGACRRLYLLTFALLQCLVASGHALCSETIPLQPLAIPVSSFGAVAVNDSIFVFGGHTAPVHEWSKMAVTGKFFAMDMGAEQPKWHPLESEQALQGMNIVAYEGNIYRAGGMEPQNKPGTSADNYSVATVSRFNLQKQKWEPFKEIPEPRSSHDVILHNGVIYIVGGWDMRGEDEGEYWCDTISCIDLKDPDPEWQTMEQPFMRRALIAASFDDSIWVLGGFTDEDEITREVNVFNIEDKSWALGPQLPEGQFNGFASAACVFENQLIVSVADGKVLKLSKDRKDWQVIAETDPRIVHRMVSVTDGVVLLGGANGGHNLDTVEFIKVP
jgi:N-acetylneuraminic acid mutarotase